MAVFDIFSKRLKKQTQGTPDVYQYEDLPKPFRVQVTQILRASLGRDHDHNYGDYPKVWRWIHDTLAKELGVFNLTNPHWDYERQCLEFLLTTDTLHTLDLIELALWVPEILAPEFRKFWPVDLMPQVTSGRQVRGAWSA